MNSPIENALLAAIRSSVPELYTLWDACDEQDQYAFGPQGVRPIDPNHPALHSVDYACDFYGVDPDENEDIDNSFFIWSGVRVATYRVDFMIERDKHRRLIVECDGHEFHDRTKQQAAYDRARDRELFRMGLPTIRFTGSEIHHSPERCAAEVWTCLFSMQDIDDLTMDAWRHGREYQSATAVESIDITGSLGG